MSIHSQPRTECTEQQNLATWRIGLVDDHPTPLGEYSRPIGSLEQSLGNQLEITQ